MTGKPIELHCDLDVAPDKEPDLVTTFHSVFAPAMSKQPGFVAVTLLKLDSAKAGAAPANASHRLVISFDTEQQRLAWVATDIHQRVWPQMEKNLQGAKFTAVLWNKL
jgi:heme-degrading monooxygenase HmoA